MNKQSQQRRGRADGTVTAVADRSAVEEILIERGSQAGRMRLEAAIRSWVRQDDRVAKRVAAVERNQREHIVGILCEIGFTRRIAEEWSETALLLYLGQLDRATRDPESQQRGRALGDFLSEMILAASARSGNSTPELE